MPNMDKITPINRVIHKLQTHFFSGLTQRRKQVSGGLVAVKPGSFGILDEFGAIGKILRVDAATRVNNQPADECRPGPTKSDQDM